MQLANLQQELDGWADQGLGANVDRHSDHLRLLLLEQLSRQIVESKRALAHRPARPVLSNERFANTDHNSPVERMRDVREQLAAYLGCGPLDIVWTSGATESNNLVMHHYAQALDPLEEVWFSAIEHPCVIEAAQRQFAQSEALVHHTTVPLATVGGDVCWITAPMEYPQYDRAIAYTNARPALSVRAR